MSNLKKQRIKKTKPPKFYEGEKVSVPLFNTTGTILVIRDWWSKEIPHLVELENGTRYWLRKSLLKKVAVKENN